MRPPSGRPDARSPRWTSWSRFCIPKRRLSEMGDVLVFAEHQGGHFPKTTLVAVNAGLELARKRGGNCITVIMGEGAETAAAEIAKYGVSKVIVLEDPRLEHHLADAAAQAFASLTKNTGAETVLATATAMGK